MVELASPKAPTFYFVGVTTGSSSIMAVFPKWMEALGQDAQIRGIDLPPHAPAEDYRQVAGFIKSEPLALGALVTTHKLDLYAACAGMFDYADPFAEKLQEVSCLSKRGGRLRAHAKDPISSGLALEAFVPENFWRDHGGEALLLGAGGSSLAMSLYLARPEFGSNAPRRITIANRSAPRLDAAREKLGGLGALGSLNGNVEFRYEHRPDAAGNDALVAALPPYSLVVNATGLGKDAPGSPTTDAVDYPENSLVWEINYRGDLLFMRQAQAQAAAKNLRVEDGWAYFVHGWSQVVGEAFGIEMTPERAALLGELAKS
jgi:shikimate 5-dehydrogenase